MLSISEWCFIDALIFTNLFCTNIGKYYILLCVFNIHVDSSVICGAV